MENLLKVLPFLGAISAGVRLAWSPITKLLFLGAYAKSHHRWAGRHRLGASWHSLGDCLEYSLYLALEVDPDPKIPKIAIRAKDCVIDDLALIFEAQSGASNFQEHIKAVNVGSTPIIFSMGNIPHQKMWVANGGIHFSWDSYQLRCSHISLGGGRTAPRTFSGIKNLTQTWLLNSTWRYRWGRYWNLDAITYAKQELMLYWRFGFCSRGVMYVCGLQKINRNFSALNFLRSIDIPRIFGAIMAQDILLNIQFWIAWWSHLFVLNADSKLEFRWWGKH